MVKLLPPILFLLFVLAIALINIFFNEHLLINFPYNVLGVPILAIGLVAAMAGKHVFKKLEANVMTFDEPTLLITQGIYQYTRNPMYLGFAVALVGFCILAGASTVSLLLTASFIVITDRWYIAYEEKMMRKKFGSDYETYCQSVRRWI